MNFTVNKGRLPLFIWWQIMAAVLVRMKCQQDQTGGVGNIPEGCWPQFPVPQPPWIKFWVTSRPTTPILFCSVKLKQLLDLIKEHIGDEKHNKTDLN